MFSFLSYFNRVRRRYNGAPEARLFFIILWCFLLFVAFTLFFKFFEEVDWEEAIWQAWQTFTTVGYGNQPAETTGGRITTMLLSTLGIAFVGSLFSTAFDYKEYLKDKKRLGEMDNPLKEGYVIFNYPGRSVLGTFIKELRNVEIGVGICVVDGQIEQLPEEFQTDNNLHFIKGNVMSQDTYEKANIHENKAVIVFPVDKYNKASDGSTRTIVELVSRYTKEDDSRIMHVLVDEENEWMFDSSVSTQVYGDLEVLALVQECQGRYSAPIVEQLLSNTKGPSPITVEPTKITGWTWGKLEDKMLKTKRSTGMNCNLFALVNKEGELSTCPTADTVIKEGDFLSIIIEPNFDWEEFEEALVSMATA